MILLQILWSFRFQWKNRISILSLASLLNLNELKKGGHNLNWLPKYKRELNTVILL